MIYGVPLTTTPERMQLTQGVTDATMLHNAKRIRACHCIQIVRSWGWKFSWRQHDEGDRQPLCHYDVPCREIAIAEMAFDSDFGLSCPVRYL